MGCATSRMDPGEEIPSGLLPFMRRIHDLKRTKTDLSREPRRERKDSIVSTTELLRPEERDIDYYDAAAMEDKDESNGKGIEISSDSSEVGKEKVEKVEEEEERRIGFGRDTAAAEEAEELPGSPSFRFYCTDAVQGLDNPESVQTLKPDVLNRIEEKDLAEEKEDHTESLITGEGSDFKATKKRKNKKIYDNAKSKFSER